MKKNIMVNVYYTEDESGQKVINAESMENELSKKIKILQEECARTK